MMLTLKADPTLDPFPALVTKKANSDLPSTSRFSRPRRGNNHLASVIQWLVLGMLSLCMSGCMTVAPSTLTAVELASLRVESIEVQIPDPSKIFWTAAQDNYLQSRGLPMADAAARRSPEIRAYVDDLAAQHLKAALSQSLSERNAGSRPVRLVVMLLSAEIPSALERILIGGHPKLAADIDVLDARTGVLLTTYKGGTGFSYAGQGIGGTFVDAALVSAGRDDLFDRTAHNYANRFRAWLTPTQS